MTEQLYERSGWLTDSHLGTVRYYSFVDFPKPACMAAKRRKLSHSAESVQLLAVADDDDDLIAGIALSEESTDQIIRLFKIIDKNSDGSLDVKDFQLTRDITGAQHKKWAELRDKFDFDGDGTVTLSEFRRGFKKMVLKLACTVVGTSTELTIEGYLKELERYINEQVQELCRSAYLWYTQG